MNLSAWEADRPVLLGRVHLTVKHCSWIDRLVMIHSCSVSGLQVVCAVHEAYDSFQVLSVHYVRGSGVVNVEVLDSQLPEHWKCANKWGQCHPLFN